MPTLDAHTLTEERDGLARLGDVLGRRGPRPEGARTAAAAEPPRVIRPAAQFLPDDAPLPPATRAPAPTHG
jgi:hypothetical protein